MSNPMKTQSAHNVQHVKSVDISPEAVERMAQDLYDRVYIHQAITMRALRTELTASASRITELETENRHLRAEVYE